MYVATFQQHLHIEYISQLIRNSRALVNNVFPAIVNDMKTEYMNNLPYPNDLPPRG
jgi:hypothetical protein